MFEVGFQIRGDLTITILARVPLHFFYHRKNMAMRLLTDETSSFEGLILECLMPIGERSGVIIIDERVNNPSADLKILLRRVGADEVTIAAGPSRETAARHEMFL